MDLDNTINSFKNEALKKKSENTVQAYVTDIEQFIEHIRKDIFDISQADVDSFKKHCFDKKLKPKTINRKLVSLRRFFNYIIKNIDTNKICVDIDMVKIQRQEYLEEILEKTDFERIIRAAQQKKDTKAIALFYGMYLTGARVSEIIQLKIDDADNDIVSVKGKGQKYRDLFVPDSLKEYFNDYLLDRGIEGSEFMFVNSNNREPMTRRSVDRLVKKYGRLARIKLSKAHAHNFRHLYAFSLVERGLTLDEIADLLGHTDINTTRIYSRKTKKQLLRIIKNLE